MTLLGRFRMFAFGISAEETTFARRGFRPAEPGVQRHLEQIGRTFVAGYLAALADARPRSIADRLQVVEPERRGFAFEGAAMGLALLDFVTPWRRDRLAALLAGPGADHVYMVHVGVGWAAARIPWARRRLPRILERFDPVLRWLVIDGFGFHQVYFDAGRTIERQQVPRGLSPYGQRAFDQGVGRCLWFALGADVARVEQAVGRFPARRRADLWSGLGLASAYAGGAGRAALEMLGRTAGDHRAALAQGAAFAAKVRQRAGNPAAHTELACQLFAGMSADEAAGRGSAGLRDLAQEDSGTVCGPSRRRGAVNLGAVRQQDNCLYALAEPNSVRNIS